MGTGLSSRESEEKGKQAESTEEMCFLLRNTTNNNVQSFRTIVQNVATSNEQFNQINNK